MNYGLISVAAGAICVFENFKTVEIDPGFSVTCHHRCEYRGNIYIKILSVIHRWKKLVIPAFVHSFHSFCHCSFVSCCILLISLFIGILLKSILAALSHAAAFASRSASSFPTIPTWALTHHISMFQSALSRLVIFFFISSTRWLWFLVFRIESIVILLSMKIVAARGVFCGMSIFSNASRALVIANCSDSLFDHPSSNLNFYCRARSVPMYSATPDPTPFRFLLPSV